MVPAVAVVLAVVLLAVVALAVVVWAKAAQAVAVLAAAVVVLVAAVLAVAVLVAAVLVAVVVTAVVAMTEVTSTVVAIITNGLLFGVGRHVKCGLSGTNNAGLFGRCKPVRFTQPHGHQDIIVPSTTLQSIAVQLAAGLIGWPKRAADMHLLTTQDMPPTLPSRPENGLLCSAGRE